MNLPHISEGAKHKLWLAVAAVLIVGVAYAIHLKNAQGPDLGSEQGDSGLAGGGIRSLLSKLAGGLGGGSGNMGQLPLPPSYADMPLDTGGSAFNLDSAPSDTGTSSAVQNFVSLLAQGAPVDVASQVLPNNDPNLYINQVIAHESATLPIYGPRPEVGGYKAPADIFGPGFTANGNPINPLTGGDVTPQNLQNLGNTSAQYDANATADTNAGAYYSQPGAVDGNGQSWVGGSPPTT